MVTKFVLAGNGPHLNRGCEAIVRGTVEILRHAFGECQFTNAYFPQGNIFEPQFEPDPDIESRPANCEKMAKGLCWDHGIRRRLPYRVRKHLLMRERGNILFCDLKNTIRESRAVLSIGGDNYTLDYGHPILFLALDGFVRRCHRPLVIWGASVGPFDKYPSYEAMMLRHLKKDVDAIFLREENSYEYLKKAGLEATLRTMADPAFVMPRELVSENDLGFSMPKGAIGINLSPLMARYVAGGDHKRWKEHAVQIVHNVSREFSLPIVLIPHVMIPGNDDHDFLKSLRDEVASTTDSIHLVPRHLTASQLKGIISQLRCLVAARTHATIASFSTGVPTLSLAYSTKAFGLNSRLFGHLDYVVSPESLSPEAVVAGVCTVLEREDVIKQQLGEKIPAERSHAFMAGECLKEILERKCL